MVNQVDSFWRNARHSGIRIFICPVSSKKIVWDRSTWLLVILPLKSQCRFGVSLFGESYSIFGLVLIILYCMRQICIQTHAIWIYNDWECAYALMVLIDWLVGTYLGWWDSSPSGCFDFRVSYPQHEWHASKTKAFSVDDSSIVSFITHDLPQVTTPIMFCLHKGHR